MAHDVFPQFVPQKRSLDQNGLSGYSESKAQCFPSYAKDVSRLESFFFLSKSTIVQEDVSQLSKRDGALRLGSAVSLDLTNQELSHDKTESEDQACQNSCSS